MDNHEIVEGIKAGDKNSFDTLYNEYYLILYRTAYLILGHKHDAEDVLQETFVTIYTKIDTLKDETKLKSWIFSILKNSCYKKYKNKKREFPDEHILFKVDTKTYENSEDNFLLKSEIHECLMKLKPKHREVLVLYYFDDLTIKEMATVCNTFQGTIKSRLNKARKELKKELKKVDETFLTRREGIYEKQMEPRV